MHKKSLYFLWGAMFIICAGLGFIPEPEGAVRALLTALSALFFLPPAVLLFQAAKAGDKITLQLVRNLSLLSLALTMVVLVLNVVFAMGSEWVGNLLHGILVIISSPMICSGHWAMSLFLWACLLMVSLRQLKKK